MMSFYEMRRKLLEDSKEVVQRCEEHFRKRNGNILILLKMLNILMIQLIESKVTRKYNFSFITLGEGFDRYRTERRS